MAFTIIKIMKSIKQANLKNKKIVLRVDFNVPINSSGKIIDDRRIVAALPTIKFLLNAKVDHIFIISHLGQPVLRPKEKMQNIIFGNSHLVLKPVVEKFIQWLKIPTQKIELTDIADSPLPGYAVNDKITVLENVRFCDGEKKNDAELARFLAILGDLYVNDGFGVLHRKDASVCAITKFVPSYYGLLVEKELKNLDKLLENPEHPFVVILGGAKTIDKMKIIQKLLSKADYFLLGGVMANTFLATRNVNVKNSVIERARLGLARELMDRAAKKIILPTDLVWDRQDRIVDIKSGTVEQYGRYIKKAKTIFFNGTMGLTSVDRFCKGTAEILKKIAQNKDAKSIICGGDTVAEADKLGISDQFGYISTGGGATLSYLAGEKLPGLEALDEEREY